VLHGGSVLALLAFPHLPPPKKNSSNFGASHKWPWSGLGGPDPWTPPPSAAPPARFFRRKTPLGIIHNLEIDSVTVINDSNSDSHHAADSDITQEKKLRQLNEKFLSLQQNSLTADDFHKLMNLLFRSIDLFATSMHNLQRVAKIELSKMESQMLRRVGSAAEFECI